MSPAVGLPPLDETPHPRIMEVGAVSWAFGLLLHLLGASLLAVFLAIRTRSQDFSSLSNLRQISIPRLLLVFLYFTSWLFLTLTAVIQEGVGLFLSWTACKAGIYSCMALYSLCKMLVYVFLAERVYVVWCPTLLTPRHKSPVYLVCICAVGAYMGVVLYMITVAKFTLSADDYCFVGMGLDGAIILLAYDVLASLVLTCLFVWPLMRDQLHSLQLKRTARRSVIAASITLFTSCVNISVLAAMGGLEHAWVLIACWECDLLVGASALFWATSGTGLRPLVSVLDSARHYEETHTRNRKRNWLPPFKEGLSPSFIASRPEVYRQGSLPTIMTHGETSTDGQSEDTSISTVPRSISIHRHHVWSSLIGGVLSSDPEIRVVDPLRDEKGYEEQRQFCHSHDHCDSDHNDGSDTRSED